MSEKKKYIIDVDLIIEAADKKILSEYKAECEAKAKKLQIDVSEFPETPPGYKKINNIELAEICGIAAPVLSGYKTGNTPGKMLNVFLVFEKLTGLKLTEYVKEIDDNGNILHPWLSLP